MSVISAIGTANPPHRFSQDTLASFMIRAMQLDHTGSRKLRTVFRASGIQHRHSVLEDYGKTHDYTFYANTPDFTPIPSTAQRMDIFRQHALKLSVDAVHHMGLQAHQYADITHLVVVCCTGMYAPGLDIELVQALNLPTTIQRTCITFMGCYAAFNALKIADHICRANTANKVLVVCTELCSLHFQRNPTDDNLLANALFADGAAAVLVEGESTAPVQLALRRFHNDLAPAGRTDMAWHIGDTGFEMKLSAYVPDVIRQGIGSLTARLLDTLALTVQDIRYFAIHPGGKKILEAIEHALQLTPEHNQPAYRVLRDYGNMSSPTVLFVLNEIWSSLKREDDGQSILSFAFGPGLTLESLLLTIRTV